MLASLDRVIDQNVVLQITTGEEGFLSSGGPGSGWKNDGTIGTDWEANLRDPNIAFGTVHACAYLCLYNTMRITNSNSKEISEVLCCTPLEPAG